MAQGLLKNWRQPIYYDFDTAMSSDVLLSIIQQLYQAGYIVLAVTCDMGPSNVRLWHHLNIGIGNTGHSNVNNGATDTEKNCFHLADNCLRILFYADIPHLLKLARNNFFDSGF